VRPKPGSPGAVLVAASARRALLLFCSEACGTVNRVPSYLIRKIPNWAVATSPAQGAPLLAQFPWLAQIIHRGLNVTTLNKMLMVVAQPQKSTPRLGSDWRRKGDGLAPVLRRLEWPFAMMDPAQYLTSLSTFVSFGGICRFPGAFGNHERNRVCGSVARRSSSAAVKRDLPIPGSPESNTTWPSPVFAFDQRRSSRSSSSSRPTSSVRPVA